MSKLGKVLTYTLLLAWTLVCLVPIYWVAITSIKSIADIDKPPGYLPFIDFMPSLDAWRFILFAQNENLLTRFLNSALIAGSATVLTLVVSGMAIYGLTRLAPAAGRRAMPASMVIALMLASRILPPVVLVIPLYTLAVATGTRDTLVAMVFVYTALNIPVAVWLLMAVLGPRATEQEEAAQLDGASHIGIFFSILLPMVKAGVAASGLIVFLMCWNEYLLAAYLTADQALTLPPWAVGQLSMKEAQAGGGAEEWAHLSAATILMMVPALLFAAFVQKQLGRSVIAK